MQINDSTSLGAVNATTDVSASQETHGVAYAFALLQLKLAQDNKGQVESYMEQVRFAQDFKELYEGQSGSAVESVFVPIDTWHNYENAQISRPNTDARKKIYSAGGEIIGYLVSSEDAGKMLDASKDLTGKVKKLTDELATLNKNTKKNAAAIQTKQKELDKLLPKNAETSDKYTVDELNSMLENTDFSTDTEKYIQLDAENLAALEAKLGKEIQDYDVNDYNKKTSHWVKVSDIESYYENIDQEIQSNMVYVQNFLGQYNSYLEGASKAISTATQLGQTLAGHL